MQYAAVAALTAPKEWYDNMNRVYRSRRDLAGQIMNALGCEFSKEQVGMFLWGKIPADIESSEALANKVLYDANIFITPGFIFGSCGERYIRISLCCKNEVLQEALNRIKKIIK
jgi:aspartate/methionine/tyrosine aminotransferase